MLRYPHPGFRLIEPIPIEDDYCTALACVEKLGVNARFVLYTEQTNYEGGGHTVYMVKRKIVMPVSAIGPGIELTLRTLGPTVFISAAAYTTTRLLSH